MSQEVKDALVDALENQGGEDLNVYLANCLGSSEKEVLDESIFKRKRGRPRKEEVGDKIDLPEDRYARAAILADRKEKARIKDRLNPGTTKEEKQKIALNADLRDIGWDLDECPGKDSDFREMTEELSSLKKEAGMSGSEESEFPPNRDFEALVKSFKDLREEVVLYFGKAKDYLGKNDFRRVEEFVSYLKDKPKVLTEKYEEIEKAYDKLCEALCSVADCDRKGMGAENPTSLEVEKSGFGMMEGEDYETYSSRMKSLGMGRDVPKTISEVDGMVEHTERRWRSVAGLSKTDFDNIKANWQKTMRMAMKKCSIGSNLKVTGLNRMLEYGLDFGDYDIAYGIMQPMSPYRTALPMGGQYGNVIVKWKTYKAVATMAFSDSISMGRNGFNYVCPSFVTAPSPCSFNPSCTGLLTKLKNEVLDVSLEDLCKMADVPYCELQLHGDGENYGADAVDSIYFDSEYDICNMSLGALAAIEEYRIPLFVKDVQVKIEDGKIVKEGGKGGNK